MKPYAHTQEPWNASGNFIYGANHAPIARLSLNTDVMTETDDANAKLIIHAPELLEILVSALKESKYSVSGPTDPRADDYKSPVWVYRAREVIASATI